MDARKHSWQMQNGFCTTVLYTMEVGVVNHKLATD